MYGTKGDGIRGIHARGGGPSIPSHSWCHAGEHVSPSHFPLRLPSTLYPSVPWLIVVAVSAGM